jgi:hypothetical protein
MRTRLAPLLAAAATLMPFEAPAGDVVRLTRFDGALGVVSEISWDAGGAVVAPLHALPGGTFGAVVVPAAAGPRVVRWASDGKELSRAPAAVKGDPRTSRVRRDGALVVVTDVEVALVDLASGAVLGRHALPAGAVRATEAAEAGAWLLSGDPLAGRPERLTWAGLDGTVRDVPLPATAPPLAWCRDEWRDPGRCPWRATIEGVLATGDGGIVVAESLLLEHDAGGDRLTRQAALTALAPGGSVAGRAVVGDTRRSLEWFWFDRSPGNLSILPGRFGLVRRRWEGTTSVRAMVERDGGGLVAIFQGDPSALVRFDRSLVRGWSHPVPVAAAAAISPRWARGVFLWSGGTTVHAFDDAGGSERRADFWPSAYDPASLRAAVGQAPDGSWLLAFY